MGWLSHYVGRTLPLTEDRGADLVRETNIVKLPELADYSSKYSLLSPLPRGVIESQVLPDRPFTKLSSVVKLSQPGD